ncbi:MAG: hypothetical protein IJ188_01135 [Clostridia bacterium]|nr:hypothetical protein [Clostridia bacterium]
MRKRLLWMLCVLLTVCCGAALAATDTTEYTLDSIYAKVTLSDSYVVLLPGSIGQHPEILTARNTTEEAFEADWAARGVLMQAWVPDLDACLEIRAAQDEEAETYFDISAQTTQMRTNYRAAHTKGTKYKDMGYTIQATEWYKSSADVRFLQIKYKRDVNGLVTRGYADKTVKNGWTIVLDYQVYGRAVRDKDLNSLKKVARTLTFTESQPLPQTTKGTLTFTATPPTETNVSSFTVEGTTTPGAQVIGTLMRYANPTPKQFKVDANSKTGKFKLTIKMDSEGVWLLTMTVDLNGNTIAEHVFEPTTYQSTMLPLTLDTPVPDQFESDEFVLSGKTTKGVSIQCIVTGGAKTYDKTVRTNNSGKFSFKIPTDTQSEYSITLVMQKKNYDTKRYSWTANRTLTERDIQNQYKSEAVKPAYTTLTRKLEAYTGRIMGYKVYITDIQQVGEEYIISAAMTKTKKGTLKDIIVITTGEEPAFVVGSEQTFYGRLEGAYEVQSEEDTEKYPSFELLFWE